MTTVTSDVNPNTASYKFRQVAHHVGCFAVLETGGSLSCHLSGEPAVSSSIEESGKAGLSETVCLTL